MTVSINEDKSNHRQLISVITNTCSIERFSTECCKTKPTRYQLEHSANLKQW